MLTYISRRILVGIPVVFGVTLIIFMLMHISGDPVRLMYGPNVPKETIEAKRKELGLDKPIYEQYFIWISKLLHGDLGRSIHVQDRVSNLIRARLAATLELTTVALLVTVFFSVPIGVVSAVKPYSWIDNVGRIFALFWVSMPYFWLGIILMLLFGVTLGLLPISGRGGPIWSLEGIRHLILPTLTLGLPPMALFTRLVRSSMLEVINEEYIRTARSKGLSEKTVIYRHALRNALIPVVTLLALRLPWLVGGAVITETVFSWPGMGRLLVDAVTQRDYPVVQGVVLILAVLVLLSNLAADVMYAYLDPRIRLD
ncbi:ABC transporter permease [Candidatus Micrarchaeota archaeon]|nr:MAG: ABC transporter permease [Candidatus Micrarchaeota archaeon]